MHANLRNELCRITLRSKRLELLCMAPGRGSHALANMPLSETGRVFRILANLTIEMFI